MNRVIGIAVTSALALSAPVLAQTATQKPPAEHTVTGCVAKGATATAGVIHNTAEKGPRTIGIVETKTTLAPHVGRKVNVTGVDIPAAEAEAMKPAPPKADRYMKVSTVRMVSATCP